MSEKANEILTVFRFLFAQLGSPASRLGGEKSKVQIYSAGHHSVGSAHENIPFSVKFGFSSAIEQCSRGSTSHLHQTGDSSVVLPPSVMA